MDGLGTDGRINRLEAMASAVVLLVCPSEI